MAGAVVQGLASGAIYALVAVGLILVFKGSRVLNLAQGEMGAFAFLSSMALIRAVGGADAIPEPVTDTPLTTGLLLLVMTVVMTAVLGIAIERFVMRPLVDRPAVQGTIATLGIAIVLINVEALFDRVFLPPGRNSYPISAPATVGTGRIDLGEAFGNAALVSSLLVAVVATGALGLALFWFFNRTKFGLGVVAATSDDTVARILGIPVRSVYRFTWGVGGALAGLAAALAPATATLSGQIQPGDLTLILIQSLAGAVIGGLDSIWGGIVGGLLVGLVIAVARFSFPSVAGIENLAILVIVVGTLIVRPRGLLGGAGAEVA